MAQVFTHTLINGESDDGTYDLMTNQGNVVARTAYVSGTFTGTVAVEASPDESGDDWYTVLSETTAGAHAFDVDPVCKRLRGKLSSMVSGSVTLKVCCRLSSRG